MDYVDLQQWLPPETGILHEWGTPPGDQLEAQGKILREEPKGPQGPLVQDVLVEAPLPQRCEEGAWKGLHLDQSAPLFAFPVLKPLLS